MKVCIAIPFNGEAEDLGQLEEAILSVDQSDLETEIVVINDSPISSRELSKRAGVRVINFTLSAPLVPILHVWRMSDAALVGYLNSTSIRCQESLEQQVEQMQAERLSASYGDYVIRSPDTMQPEYMMQTRKFEPTMLGSHCFSSETMLIHRDGFKAYGGFDNPFGAAYRPNVFLTTTAALAGPIAHVDAILIHQTKLAKTPELLNDLCETQDEGPLDGRELWKRMRFDGFVNRAIKLAKQDWANI